LLVLGDRFEMHAAVVASLPFTIPVAHIHGGESTRGAIDEAMRHSITKMSHLHFVTAETYARRVIQMGEEPWRVVVTGAPSLDNLRSISLRSREELEREYGLDPADPFLLVTFHPATLEYEDTDYHVTELLAALDRVDYPLVFTYPNADTRGRRIIRMIKEFSAGRPKVLLLDNLGTRDYMSMMNHARAMAGNSSSGIIEAASFRLPVVNIGTRQEGRIRERNVIDVGYGRSEVLAGIQKAVSPRFQAGLAGLTNPHGDGHAAEPIVDVLKTTPIDDRLMLKRFHDMPQPAEVDVGPWQHAAKIPLR
jgi:UDP-hydrolysing UDP-N-acetyl-D-glucosamine 2-epimerase